AKVSYINLNKWVQYYYIKWFGKNPTSMIRELLAYKENSFPFNEPSLLELEQTPLDYWSFLSDSVPDLSQIATKLFSICVNSASCERLFSSMGFLHTKRRNKLNYSKVLWMAQIRGELQREKFIKSIRFDDQRVKNNRIAVPVGNEEIDNIMLEPPELDGLDEEDISEDDISDNEIDINLNELLNIQIHPADNDNAKWDLTTLFKSQL
ncbi:21915_t:CDS:2, partial [Gigaspora rosea]